MTNTTPPRKMTDSGLNFLCSTMDAELWATEFCKLNRAADHGAMLAWFACAIMAGYDEATRRAAQPQVQESDWLSSVAQELGVKNVSESEAAAAGYATPAQPVSQPPAVQGVPDGWQLVPIDPTVTMGAAFHCEEGESARNKWDAMLAAAPQPGEQNDR